MQRNLIALAIAVALGMPGLAMAARSPSAHDLAPATRDQTSSLAEGRRQFAIAVSHHSTVGQSAAAAQKVIATLQPLAAQGVPEANWMLGYLYGTGYGVMVDRKVGIQYARKAADAGYAPAAQWLGTELWHSSPIYPWQNVENNEALAYRAQYAQATGHGSVKAAPITVAASKPHSVAPIMSHPVTIIPSKVVSAASAGTPVAVAAVNRPLPTSPPAPLDQPTSMGDLREALAASNERVHELEQELAHVHADPALPPAVARPPLPPMLSGADAVALNRTAVHLVGQGDFESAVPLLRRAAAAGFAPAEANLGAMYLNGTGGNQDTHQAVELLQRAANRGNAVAACNLGRIYELGIGIHADRERAYAAYRQAEQLGSPTAARALARLRAGTW